MKLKRKIVGPVLGILLALMLIAADIGGCTMNRETGPSKEQEEIFEHVLNILQTVRSEKNECGMFKTKDIREQIKYQKMDTSRGGSYTREKKTVSDGKNIIKYEFKDYTGDLQMPDGKIVALTGVITGEGQSIDPGKIRLKGEVAVFCDGQDVGSVYLNRIQIDNGADGSKCGTLESLVLIDSTDHSDDYNILEFFHNTKAPYQKLKLKVNNIAINDREKELWQQFIGFTNMSVFFEKDKKITSPDTLAGELGSDHLKGKDKSVLTDKEDLKVKVREVLK